MIIRFLIAALLVGFFSLDAAERTVFCCDFGKGLPPVETAAPCRAFKIGAELVQAPSGGALRIGKTAEGTCLRAVYRLNDTKKAARLFGAKSPFPLRQGKLHFRFRPVDWKIGNPGVNMLLQMRGPNRSRIHVTYLRPSVTGVGSVQACYGVPGAETVGAKKQPALFPFAKLDPEREWHDVDFEWSPSQVKITVDGESFVQTTLYLELPDSGFYADTLELGTDYAGNLNGMTEIADLRIAAPEDETAPGKLTMPLLQVPQVDEAPVIDGKIDEQEYAGALKTTGFLALPGGRFSSRQSTVYLSHDTENIYLALVSPGHNRKPVAAKIGHDSALWEDDSVDFMLDPTPETPDFYQLIFHWGNDLYDSHVVPKRNDSVNRSWNSDGVRFASSADDQVWQLEAVIPLKNFGSLPSAGSEWKFSICETNPGDGTNILVNAVNGALEYDKYGLLRFGGQGETVFRMDKIGDLQKGEMDLLCRAAGISINCRRYDETAMTEFPLFGETVNAQNGVCRFGAGQDRFGKNGVCYFQARDEKGKVIYAAKWPYETFDTASIENMRRIPDKRKGDQLQITTSQSPGKNLSLLFFLTDRSGKTLRSFAPVPVKTMRQISRIPLTGIAPGEYRMEMHLIGPGNTVVKKAESRELVVYPAGKLPWHGNRLGISDQPAPPWTPMTLTKNGENIETGCWNRRYIFTKGELFPSGIVSGNSSYLAAAPQLAADFAGRKIVAKGGAWQIIQRNARRIILENSGVFPEIGTLKVRATIDYDGFIWFDLNMSGCAGNKADTLRLTFTVPPEQAKLLNSGYRDLTDTGKLPAKWSKMISGQFGAFWVGDENGGLSFGIESDQFWSNADSGKQATLLRTDRGCEISLNFADVSTMLTAKTQYGFYVMPTPVRPRPEVFRTLRTMMLFAHNREELRGNHYPDNLSWWNHSYQYQGSPAWVTDVADIAAWCKYTGYGVTMQPYNNYDILPDPNYRTSWYADYSSVARNAPETVWQGEFWRAGDKDKLYGNAVYGYHDDMIEVCKTDDYCDYYLWRYDQCRKNDPKIGGIYFDLMQYPPCAREDHGHGYATAKGRIPTYAIREHRKFLERIYQYTRQSGTAAPVIMHMSGATARIAGFSFADYYLDGELWCENLVRDRSYKNLSLDQFRAELLPHIYGQGIIYCSQLYRILAFVPAEERKAWKMSPWAERHLVGMLLCHDVVPDRTSLHEVALGVWKALDKFGLSEKAVFLPYWKPETLGHRINMDGATTAANIWREEDGRELLLLFNNRDEATQFRIQDCAGLTATDMESGEKSTVTDGILKIEVPVRNFRLIELRQEK